MFGFGRRNGKFDIHQRVYKISDFNKKLNGYFFFLYFSNNFFNRIMQMTAKSSVDSVRMEMIADMQIPVPTKSEQTAIATVLSDTDALIECLEKLIAKKKAIKQGAMQQLLTGKKRLPGFSGEWEVKKLGEFLDYKQPTEYLVTDTEYNNNNQTPVLTAGKTFILGYTNEEHGIFNKLPVIIFDDFTTAIKFVDFPFKAKSSAMKMLIPKNDKVNMRFIYEIMSQIKYPLGDHKRHWIVEYQHLEITVPESSEEQAAIAGILSDMDAEIESLEQKRNKYIRIKQGMMQELLTGKIRLNH
ncbi:MAG: restriction endonuclease subunit S [Elusimicrobiota bacterium]